MHEINPADISGEFYDYTRTMEPETPYNYDYSKTLTMKLALAIPDRKGGSKVFWNFEEALEIIRRVDAITRGIPKIVYLVGWQYCGHDDKYPAMDEVNPYLKRPRDETAEQSLRWLMEEAFRYHTAVSLHINLTDSYADSPLWQEYLDRGIIARREDGSLYDIGVWGGKTSCQIDYKAEWESGCLQTRIQRLLKLLPIQKAGTIHIDAYLCRTFAGTSLEEQRRYRRKTVRYFRALGVDVTSEFLYNCPGRDEGTLPPQIAKSQRDDLIGLVPMVWWLNQGMEGRLNRPARLLCGGRYNPDLDPSHSDAPGFLAGNSAHGEGSFQLFRDADPMKWQRSFLAEFALDAVFWYWQNQLRLLEIRGEGENAEALYEGEYRASAADRTIRRGEILLRAGGDMLAPLLWREGEYLAYSQNGYAAREWLWDGPKIRGCFSWTENGWLPADEKCEQRDGRLILSLKPEEALLLQTE